MLVACAATLLFGAAASAIGSSGRAKAHCHVPGLVGSSLHEAETKLRQAGCRVGAIRRHASTLRRESRVLRQQLSAGRRRPAGAKVGLLVGKGPRHLLPQLAAIIPRRLPPFVTYERRDPDGNSPDVWLVAPDGSDPHQAVPPLAQWPSWSPDATQILYTDYCFLLVTTPAGNDGRVLYPPGLTSADGACVDNVQQARWSPNGNAIVFTLWPDGPHPIYLENVDGSGLRPVPNTDGAQDASFSPDGRWIVFDKPGGRGPAWSHIYAIRLDGTGRRRLTNWGGEGEPSWSPDGTRVIYACAIHPEPAMQPVDPGGIPHAVCEISNDHPAPRTLFVDRADAVTDPTWNADGSKILVTIAGQIALLPPAGGKAAVITHSPGSGSAPDW